MGSATKQLYGKDISEKLHEDWICLSNDLV